MNELALFAGAGGGILGGHLLGWRTVCAVERDAYAAQVLAQRQNDRILRPFPIWSDVTTFDGRPWRGIVDVVSGGFPCQDISSAGKGAGIEGERSGLWNHMRRIIREIRPRRVLVENSPALTSRGLGKVLGDLAAMGFNAEWGVISAADTGAPHLRERIWIVADHDGAWELQPAGDEQDLGNGPGFSGEALADSGSGRCGGKEARQVQQSRRTETISASKVDSDTNSNEFHGRSGDVQMGWGGSQSEDENHVQLRRNKWPAEPGVGRVVDGMVHRVDRLKALGNGQVPRVAATAWRILGGPR
ncbi:MAG: DNA cytosine methyltransferase [Limnohabitans sp.]|nr:DNA cytosine methyltransferase [Limnohabitans sp.]